MNFHDTTLLLAAHGSSTDADAAAATLAVAERIRRLGRYAEVRAAFWKQPPFWREALAAAQTPRVVVVPYFVSRGYFTETVLPRELAAADCGKMVTVSAPVGTHPLMTEVLLHAAQKAAAPSAAPAPVETSLLIIGHGTPRDKNSATVIREQAAKIARTGPYAECRALFMEEPPLARDWAALTVREQVIAVPFFIAAGPHYRVDLPLMLGFSPDEKQFPLTVSGKRLWYARPAGMDERMADVVLELAAARSAAY